MSIDVWETLRQALIASPEIAEMVSDRVYLFQAPKNTQNDYIVFFEVTGNIPSRAIPCDTNIVRCRMQFSCYSQSPVRAKTICDRVARTLNRRQDLPPVEDVLLEQSSMLYDDDAELYQCSVDFEVIFDSRVARYGKN